MANKITTLFDFKEQGSGLSKIKADIQGVDGAWGKAKAGFRSAINEFRSSNAAQGVAIAGLAAGALKATEAASSLAESQNAVNTTYAEAADGIHELGKSSVEAYGQSERAFNQMAVGFAGFAQTVAGDGGNVVATVDEMATRVADFASTHDLSMEEASTKFRAALAGEAEAMRQYSVDISAANVKTYAYANGIAEAGSELTEQQKVMARYGLIMEQTDQWAGDFANTADSLANQQRQATAEWEDASAKLGENLAPALATVVGGLNDMLVALDKIKVLDAISLSWVEPLGKTIGEVLSPWNKGAREANRAIVDAFDSAERAAADFDMTLLDGVHSFDEARAIALEYAEGVDGVGDAQHAANTIALAWNDTLVEGTQAYEEAQAAALANTEAMRDQAKAADHTATVLGENNRQLDRLKGFAERAARYVESLGSEWDRFKGKLSDRNAFLNLEDAFDRARAAAEEAFAAANEGADDAAQKLRDAERAANDAFMAAGDFATEVAGLPESSITLIQAKMDEGDLNYVEEWVRRLGDGVTLPIRPQVVNSFNRTSSARGGPTLTAEGNLIPGRASGGPVSAGQTYLVGEQGPELLHMGNSSGNVIPNDKLGGGSSPTYNINVTAGMGADGAAVGRQVVEAIKAFERVNGARWRS